MSLKHTTRLDVTGKRFGRLVAQRLIGFGKRGAIWRCICDCGTSKDVLVKALQAGLIKSCGCLNREKSLARCIAMGRGTLIDMTGQQIGRLYVSHRVMIKGRDAAYWLCQCKCGNTTVVRGDLLRRREIQSCGCWQAEGASDRMTEAHWRRIKPYIGLYPIDLSLLSLDKEL